MGMNSWGTTSSATYSTASAVGYYDEGDRKPSKKKSKDTSKWSPLSTALSKSDHIMGHVSAITLRKSPLANDASGISFVSAGSIRVQIYDPTRPPRKGESKSIIGTCDFSVVAYILEHIPNTMDRANIIKTALLSLKPFEAYPYVIIAAYTRDYAEEIIGSKEVQGIDQEELEMLAIYVGANSTWKPKDIEVEGMACVAASFRTKL